jgi:hypothetical protein
MAPPGAAPGPEEEIMSVRPLLIVLLGAVAFASCKDDTTGPQPSEINGLWHATKAEYVSRDSPPIRVDIVAAGGSATLDLQANQHFAYTETRNGEAPFTVVGTWKFDTDEMDLYPDPPSHYWIFQASLANGTLTLTGASAAYDFDGVSGPDPGSLDLTLVR